MGVPIVASVVAWGVLAGGIAVVAVQNADLTKRLEAAETAAATATTRAEEVAREKTDAKAALASAQKVEAGHLEQVKTDIRNLWSEVLKAPAAEGRAADVGTPAFEEGVRRVLDRYVTEKKFRESLAKGAKPAIGKKPKFSELAKALELDDDQSDRLQKDVQSIQTELYQILQMPRADGVVILDEIAQAEQFPDGSPQKTAPFLKLFKLKIPDTDETYVERAITLVQGLKERAPEYLAIEQMDALNSMDLDFFGIKFL